MDVNLSTIVTHVHIQIHNFVFHDGISNLFGINDHHDKTMYHLQEPGHKLKNQGHIEHMNFVNRLQ